MYLCILQYIPVVDVGIIAVCVIMPSRFIDHEITREGFVSIEPRPERYAKSEILISNNQ